MKITLILIFLFFNFLGYTQSPSDDYKKVLEYIEKNDFKTALRLINKSLVTDSENIELYDKKARCEIELEQYKEALDTYSKAISINPTADFLYVNRGILLTRFLQFDSAIEDFDSAIMYAKDEKTKYQFIVNRSNAKADQRDFEGSYEDLMLAYNYNPDDILTLTNLGNVCDELGKREEAIEFLEEAINIDSTIYYPYVTIGFIYQDMGEHQKAIQYFDKVLQLDPSEAIAYSNRSYSKLKLGDSKGALNDINKSLEMYPGNSYAYRNRALIYIETGKITKACEDLQKALSQGFSISYGDEVEELILKYCQ